MKLLAKNNITARADPFVGHTERMVRVLFGPLAVLATLDEAIDLARQLVAAVDEAKAEAKAEAPDVRR